jgi:hypothetical protein
MHGLLSGGFGSRDGIRGRASRQCQWRAGFAYAQGLALGVKSNEGTQAGEDLGVALDGFKQPIRLESGLTMNGHVVSAVRCGAADAEDIAAIAVVAARHMVGAGVGPVH